MKESPEESFLQFKDSVKTLALATLTEELKPNISYAPFVEDDNGNFYLFLSQLAHHTQDLLSHSVASVLLIEDEQDTRQLFARQRITYQCQVDIVLADDQHYEIMLDAFHQRFGNIIDLLRNLPDFILFKLQPYHGQYVMGFAKAYNLVGDDLSELKHIAS
jgi:putative heme iron utilization protein